MNVQVRPYQEECVEATVAGFGEHHRQLIVLPTGGGKTIVMALLAKRLHPARVLVIAHREELIQQNAAKIYAATGLGVSIERAGEEGSRLTPVVVGSIQTLVRRCDQWNPGHFGYVFVDEAHHVMADSYQKVLAHFKSARVLGVTATPGRADKQLLSEFFDNVSYELGIFDLVRQGFLSRIMVQTVPVKIDLSHVRTIAGDFDDYELEKALMPYFPQIIDGLIEYCAALKTLVFLPLIQTSKCFVEMCVERGLLARHIDGKSENRAELLAQFDRGDFKILSNANLLLEGYDCPSIECVCILRPTRSHGLYTQMCGRGTRIFPGKKELLLLDFLYQYPKMGLKNPSHLIAATEEEAAAIDECGDGDLLANSDRAKGQREDRLRRALEANRLAGARRFDAAEFSVYIHDAALQGYEPVFAWEKREPSHKQIELVQNLGISVEGMTRGMASRLIDTVFSRRSQQLASPKQMFYLRANDYTGDLGKATFKEASAFLECCWGKKQPKAVAA